MAPGLIHDVHQRMVDVKVAAQSVSVQTQIAHDLGVSSLEPFGQVNRQERHSFLEAPDETVSNSGDAVAVIAHDHEHRPIEQVPRVHPLQHVVQVVIDGLHSVRVVVWQVSQE